MKRIGWLSTALVLVCLARVSAAELVGVHGSSTQYNPAMDIAIDGRPFHLFLTGVALRQKFFSNVYAIGS